jgi:hypothetical protein
MSFTTRLVICDDDSAIAKENRLLGWEESWHPSDNDEEKFNI